MSLNPLDSKGNYSGTSNKTKLVHWPLMGGLLHLVQRGGAWAGCGPAESPLRCTKCNSPPINGQCTNHCIAIWWSGFNVAIKGLKYYDKFYRALRCERSAIEINFPSVCLSVRRGAWVVVDKGLYIYIYIHLYSPASIYTRSRDGPGIWFGCKNSVKTFAAVFPRFFLRRRACEKIGVFYYCYLGFRFTTA